MTQFYVHAPPHEIKLTGSKMESFYTPCSGLIFEKYSVRILAPLSVTETFLSSLYVDILRQLPEICHDITHS
jgi:hypothetical protein